MTGTPVPINQADYTRIISGAEELIIGCKCYVEKDTRYRQAEILSQHLRKGKIVFYVHYVEFNKRLDEWVEASRIDFTRPVDFPKPDPPKKLSGAAARGKAKNEKKKGKKGNSRIRSTSPNTNNSSSRVNTPTGDIMDLDNLNVQGLPKEGISREDEIKKLRTGGSMAQNFSHETARVRNISQIIMGKYIIEPWYFSPYPIELTEEDSIYICEYTLSFFGSKKQFERFRLKSTLRHPPGNEIYRDENVSFFEIDGRKQRVWCRNLCLLSKLFLDHKTLYYDVDPFLFYCMTVRDEMGHHLVGYFSKEKESAESYNVACILTLPQYQRHGFGKLLIAFSYELSKKEGKVGSPEKPLSDLGLLSYRAFWAETITNLVVENNEKGDITIEEISSATAMTTTDILHTLQTLNILKYYKGQHIICITEAVQEQFNKQQMKKKKKIDPDKLIWKPPVFTASQLRFGW